MKQQQFFQHRLQTLAALSDAVGAIRSLAAHHFRRARLALPEVRRYRDEMDTIVSEIGLHQAVHAEAPSGLLIVASDLGLCGDYNSQLSHLALEEISRHASHSIYLIGRRANSALTKNAYVPIRTYDAPASLEGVSNVLLALSQDLISDYVASRIGSLHVVSANFEGVGHFRPVTAQVLPIEPVRGSQPRRRSSYVDRDELASVAAREYLYITLYEVLLDALAAEHGMRLLAAESALDWLDSTATTTARRLNAARSEAATQELLDIISGGRRKSK